MGRNTRRKFKGHDPAAAARRAYEQRRNPALWGPNEDALKLASNSDVGSIAETRTTTRRVQRFDCFATLKLSDHQFQAVRRYQADLAESYGVGDRDTSAEKVDGAGGSRELVTARSLAAGRRLSGLREQIGMADWGLLYWLSYPTWVEGAQVNWKAVVHKYRGLIDRDAQASCVKQLSENVRLAYEEIDNSNARKAA